MQQDNSFERVKSQVPEAIELSQGRVGTVKLGVMHIVDAVDVMESTQSPKISEAVLEFAPKYSPDQAMAEVIPINSQSRKVHNLSVSKPASFDPLSAAQVMPAAPNVTPVQGYAQAASDAALSTADHLRQMQDQLGIAA